MRYGDKENQPNEIHDEIKTLNQKIDDLSINLMRKLNEKPEKDNEKIYWNHNNFYYYNSSGTTSGSLFWHNITDYMVSKITFTKNSRANSLSDLLILKNIGDNLGICWLFTLDDRTFSDDTWVWEIPGKSHSFACIYYKNGSNDYIPVFSFRLSHADGVNMFSNVILHKINII